MRNLNWSWQYIIGVYLERVARVLFLLLFLVFVCGALLMFQGSLLLFPMCF